MAVTTTNLIIARTFFASGVPRELEEEAEIDGCAADIKELILDCSALEYVSSAGLRVILKAQKQMNVQGCMKLIGVNETIMEVFDITGFADILTIE